MIKNHRERKLNRLKGYDYSSDGGYFITICTKNCEYLLSKIDKNSQVILSDFGKIAEKTLIETANIYEHFILDEFVIMPNHIHFIVFIKNNTQNTKSVSNFVRSFKSYTTKTINQTFKNNSFQWQKSFYDKIIRNEEAFLNIKNYIQNNPLNWQNDEYFL